MADSEKAPLKIFVIKGSNPEKFCIASEGSGKFKGEVGRVAFFTEKNLRSVLREVGKSEVEIDAAIEIARANQQP